MEVLLALGLIVLVSGLMFSFYQQSMMTRDYGTRAVHDRHLAREIAMKIAEDIRSANGFLLGLGPGISGKEDRIAIQTLDIPDKELFIPRSIDDPQLPAECDVRRVRYYLGYDDENENYEYPDGTMGQAPLGLVRTEMKTLFQQVSMFDVSLEAEEPEEVVQDVDIDLFAPEMKYIRFRYFDGVEWLDRWDIGNDPEGGLGNSLPQAVEVTVGYKERLPPEEEEEPVLDDSNLLPAEPELYDPRTYTVVVRLWQADAFFGSRVMRAQRRSRLSMSEGGGSEGGR